MISKMENWIFWNKKAVENVYKGMTQSELFAYLTDKSRYDKLQIPSLDNQPMNVSAKIYVFHLKTSSSFDLDIEVQMLLELRWEDPRLRYSNLNTTISLLIGEKFLFDNIWIPHIFMTNEKNSLILGPIRKDDLITVLPTATVLFTTRLRSSLVCHLSVGKFPFDKQICDLVMDSWRYNTSALRLVWDTENPILLHGGKVSLAEFYLIGLETMSSSDFYQRAGHAYNYSSLILRFHLAREYGFYLMDYYVPSCLLVILSWVSFWQSPDALPSRAYLGSMTMLTFLMLGWSGDSIPRTSQFMANDVWELSCTAFIFLSLAEFAFVNTIDRSGSDSVKLKRPTTKYILKSTVSLTPREPRSLHRRRVSSAPSSPEIRKHFAQFLSPDYQPDFQKNKFGIEQGTLRKREITFGSHSPVEIHKASDARDFADQLNKALEKVKEDEEKSVLAFMMTPQEIAQWIDEKSRIVFPVAFLIFNVVYWSITLLL
ncbi:pH-sensitive chloride channel 2-like isoform X2 [Rhodnius prolixus]|uniref:pH-sensitive chloride channel 2-like isoform X2 n=1 Tax=Rhodnius prolixus TaxID=13249 RepID=UPI003D18BD59